MAVIIVRYISVCGLIGSGIWIGSDFDNAEPYVAAIFALGTFITTDVVVHSASGGRNTDRALFQRFMTVLPSNGTIAFLRSYDFGGAFAVERLNDTSEFLHLWNNPEHEFLDRKLEAERQTLLEYISDFSRAVGEHTFPMNAAGIQKVPDEWHHEQPERADQAVAELNDLAEAIVESHDALVRLAKQRLGVSGAA